MRKGLLEVGLGVFGVQLKQPIVDLRFETQDLVMMLDQSRKHLNVLIESIFPKAFTQLQIAIKFAYKIVDESELL